MPIPDQLAGTGAATVYDMLAKGNMALFLDIWPLHMFYKKFGLQRLKRCLPERQKLSGSVLWPIADKVLFGEKTAEILQGFEAVDAGNISEGVRSLALHEQRNILQPTMYDDPLFATLMRTNQFAWVTHMPTGSVQEIQLTLANQCTVANNDTRREIFSKQPLANLADVEQRMAFVLRAAQRFNELLRHPTERYDVENSMYSIIRAAR
jgi:hypothetical protein